MLPPTENPGSVPAIISFTLAFYIYSLSLADVQLVDILNFKFTLVTFL